MLSMFLKTKLVMTLITSFGSVYVFFFKKNVNNSYFRGQQEGRQVLGQTAAMGKQNVR